MSPLPPRPPLSCLRSVAPGASLRLILGLAIAVVTAGPVPLAAASTQAPVVVRRVAPVHPPELLKQLVNGEATLECRVNADGEVDEVKVLSESHAGFGAAAEEALLQWEFQPGTVDNVVKPMRVKVPFEFRLSTDQVLSVVAGRPVYAEIADTVIPAQQLPSWPTPLQFYMPRYPTELEGTGKYGKVVVNITIDPEGKVMNPKLVKATYPEFVLPALVTALKLRFPPQVMADGKAVHVNMDVQWDIKPPANVRSSKASAEGKGGRKK